MEVADHRLQWNRQWAVNPVRYGLGNRSCPWRRGIGSTSSTSASTSGVK